MVAEFRQRRSYLAHGREDVVGESEEGSTGYKGRSALLTADDATVAKRI